MATSTTTQSPQPQNQTEAVDGEKTCSERFAEILKKLHFNQSKSAVIAEFIGTFLFTLTIPLTTIQNPELAPLAFGFMKMALIFCYAYLSGGYFNPAVTIAAYLSVDRPKTLKWHRAVLYVIAQCAAALAAAFYCMMIRGVEFPVPDTQNDPFKILQMFLAESVFSFVLASVALHVAHSRQKENQFYGFAIGMTVMSAALCVGGVKSGAFNPAVATGLLVMRCLSGHCMPAVQLWLFWSSEVLGAIVGVIFYNLVSDAMAYLDEPSASARLGIEVGGDPGATPIQTEIQLQPPRRVQYGDDNEAGGQSPVPKDPAAAGRSTSPPTTPQGKSPTTTTGGRKDEPVAAPAPAATPNTTQGTRDDESPLHAE